MTALETTGTQDSGDALTAATRYSRYARRVIEAEPVLLESAGTTRPFSPAEMSTVLARHDIRDEHGLKSALRQLRKRVMVRLIARDIGGLAGLDEVVATATALAEISLATAVGHLHEWLVQQHGVPRGGASGEPQQFHVVGMGKLGGAELNVSSDIDLVFVYPEEGESDGTRPLSNHEWFTRLARRLIGIISEITEDGYVFRVDVRLRPYGDSGPLVVSFDMLENYFITQGREWERYAWIKGRPVTGDRGAELLELVRPFVFRRHLDFSAFASLRSLHQQIRREIERRDMADNIKLGSGGIREVEFLVQVFQLIRGGRDAALRSQPTLKILPLLADRRLLAPESVTELTQAYVFLRNLEHRLQYLDDQQTQTIPADTADRERIAHSMGFPDYAAFVSTLDRHRETANRHFREIFADTDQAQHELDSLWQEAGDAEQCTTRLTALGFARAAALQQRLGAMRESTRYRQMPASSQSRLDRLVPLAVAAAAGHANADDCLERLLQLLESVSRRESYLALLQQYPQALARLSGLMSASPWVAQYLTQHPILLDELLDNRTLYEPPDWPALRTQLRRALDEGEGDTEKQMDTLRHFKHVQTLHCVAQDIAGTLQLETLSDRLSDLACVLLDETTRLAWKGLRQRHRDDPLFAVIAYGKLGGKELGYASDLDLVFLHDDTAADAPENYARLAQRLNHWITSMTPAGVLYETDLRLRPDGVSGLLVSTLASFEAYQQTHAWVWEHQALTRARFVAGDAAIGRRFEALRVAVLRQPRDRNRLRPEIVAMRRKIQAAHPNASALFDVKHDPGGLIDVEFVVQYVVLGHACEHEALTANIGNLALLRLAARLGLIPAQEALAAHDAYRHLRQLQHALRLRGETYARAPHDTVENAARSVRALWESVFGAETATPET